MTVVIGYHRVFLIFFLAGILNEIIAARKYENEMIKLLILIKRLINPFKYNLNNFSTHFFMFRDIFTSMVTPSSIGYFNPFVK